MAVKGLSVTTLAAGVLLANTAYSQALSVEAAQTGGYSTDRVSAAATQVRVFGDAVAGVRFNLEAAWAARSGVDGETDAFGAAYPYGNRVQVIEAYGERIFRPRSALLAVRAGRFRTPFGIFSGSDHGYSGFLRAPLIRYDDYYGLSNNFLETGASLAVGKPSLYVETTVGTPSDVGEARRRAGLDRVVRAQGSYRTLIAGISYVSANPHQSPRFARGRAQFTGVDGRWMQSGVEIRGEWLAGQPFDGTRTSGGYLDLRIHRPALGPLTPVLRAERLAYDARPPRALYAQRYTTGGRVQVRNALTAQLNVVHQHGLPELRATALDIGLTYVFRFDAKRRR